MLCVVLQTNTVGFYRCRLQFQVLMAMRVWGAMIMKTKQYMQTRYFFACFVCTIACWEVEPAYSRSRNGRYSLYTAGTVACFPRCLKETVTTFIATIAYILFCLQVVSFISSVFHFSKFLNISL